MTTPVLPLPEIGEDGEAEFERSWIKFKLVAAANKWDDAKALLMLPALLRGKLRIATRREKGRPGYAQEGTKGERWSYL